MSMIHNLAFAAACLAICSAVVVKPVSAIENNLSGESIAQIFNTEPFTERASEKSDSSQKDETNSKKKNPDDEWLIPLLWGLGGYMVGSFVGTQKTYTKMTKGERKIPR